MIDIDSQLAKAIQPFSIARSSDHKYLGRRLFAKLAKSRELPVVDAVAAALEAGRKYINSLDLGAGA